MPSAPLAESTQSRKKLKTVHHDKNLLNQEDKENISHPDDSGDGEQDDGTTQPMSEPAFPQTPMVRIPLEDLIGNTEDAFNCPPPQATPGDHVTWHNGPASSDPSISARATQKSRKRARSSSPASSQQEREGQKDVMDLNSIQKSLRTPNNDPTQDLWNRYTNANMSRQAKADFVLPSLAHLGPSSPQTPSTTSKDSGLRRTASCGVEWPTSKPKRRKVDAGDSHCRTRDIFAASRREILAENVPKTSRVGLLVEKIQESMSKRQRVDDEPSSSSPLPNRHSQMPATQGSPTRSPSKASRLPPQTNVPVASQRSKQSHQTPPNRTEDFSDFGDDDLDIDLFESVEKQLSQQPVLQELIEIEHVARKEDVAVSTTLAGNDVTASITSKEANLPQIGPPKNQHAEDFSLTFDDDFDDEDDTFAEELQDLVDKVDSQNQVNKISTIDGAGPMPLMMDTIDEMDDDFGDCDDELWAQVADESAEGKPVIGSTSQKINNKAIKRYLILDVFEGQYKAVNGKMRPEKVLSLKDERGGLLYIVLLRQSWYDTRCTKKSYVHIIGDFDRYGQCIIDDLDNMIILHPDHLISATVVGDSFTCTRRAALQDRVKASSRATPPQVYGHILHEVFGEALRLNQWSTESFIGIIQRILPNYLESLYEIGVPLNDAMEYLLGKTPDLIGWASVFVGESMVPDAQIRDRNGSLVPTAINKLLELEEHVWSPMYGLKGNIDATVQVQMQLPGDRLSKTLVVPLELKTGKRDNVETHRAQTALYTLLLSDRYDVNVTCGVLYYLETSKTFRVESVRNEIRHMIIERNELACYVHEKLALPPMLKKQHLCKACYSKTECFTYHKLVEGGDAVTSGVGSTFDDLVGHLTPAHAEFFKKWDDLLTKEERDTMKFRRELWTMLSTERQAVGRCFANVVIEPGSAQENRESTKINRFSYTFIKHKADPGFAFTESQITLGEPIVISDEQGHFNLASGYVTNVRPTRVVVAVDRRLQNSHRKHADFDPESNQVFTGLMESNLDGTSSSDPGYQPRIYRIDRDEFANGMATARNNLIRIMEKDLFKARELRQLIIDGKPPTFKSLAPSYTLSGPASQQNLNEDQHRAIQKVMTANECALVLGMPGTGKTTTIAHIIRALVAQNKSVLLASYTHTAVDNILLKIKDDNIPVLRIGAVSKVHPEVQSFADLTGIPKQTMEELHRSWHDSKVVATTCLGINHGLFNARTFDYCIVDEASQITLPVCLGPIRHAKTFILVGDHYQLPPLVQNREAQDGGLNVSLFKLLSDAHPESVVNLEHQYRMAHDIMLLCSELVYNHRLKCGNETVAQRVLHIPNLEAGLFAYHYTSNSLPTSTSNTSICSNVAKCHLRASLDPSTRISFLNTDPLGPLATETCGNGNRITNSLESTLTAQLVTVLLRSGVNPRDIGVITFYRSQLALLERDIKAHAGSAASAELEMHTADKYQGRDKEVVILSCVRSNQARQVGELLKDWRRVNVALTRARSKLLLIGSRATLHGAEVPILKGMVEILDERGWVRDLTETAVDGHRFEHVSTQTQRSPRKSDARFAYGTLGDGRLQQPQRSPQRSPLRERTANAVLITSPASVIVAGATPPKKRSTTYPNNLFKQHTKQPSKTIDGRNTQLQNLLNKNAGSVLRDVVNENLDSPLDVHVHDENFAPSVPPQLPPSSSREAGKVNTQSAGIIDSLPFEVDSVVLDVLREMDGVQVAESHGRPRGDGRGDGVSDGLGF